MKVKCYLYVGKKGNVRLTKTPTSPSATEVRVEVNIEVPDVLFTRPTPVINLAIPDSLVQEPVEAVVRYTSEEVASALMVDVGQVTDGLMEFVRESRADNV